MSIPKPQRQTDPEYLKFIRLHRCIVPGCGQRSEAHHLTTRGAGGGDYTATPLCREHHAKLHTLGLALFEITFHLNVWRETAKLLGTYLEWRRENA